MEQLKAFVSQYAGEIVSFGLTGLLMLAAWILQARVILRWAQPHSFAHRLKIKGQYQEQEVLIHTASYLISNAGRKGSSPRSAG